MVPRVRFTLYTRGLSRFLLVADTYLYTDNTFSYLPNDEFKKRYNYFVSSFNVLFIKNFGIGLTYKNGERIQVQAREHFRRGTYNDFRVWLRLMSRGWARMNTDFQIIYKSVFIRAHPRPLLILSR